MTEPTKGQPGGECGRFLCRVRPATWYDSAEAMCVCAGCAGDLNRRSWLNRPDGSPCCSLIPASPAAAAGAYECPYDAVWP